MRFEIAGIQLDPEVFRPGMEKNAARFLAMEESVLTVGVIVPAREDNAFQSFSESIPSRNEIDERLHVPFGHNVPEAASRRFTIQYVSRVSRRAVTVLPLNTTI